MNAKTVFGWGLTIIVFLFINVIIGIVNDELVVSSDERKLQWDRFDVTIDNFDTAENTFDVVESYEITVERGPFTFGFRDLPLTRVENITNVTIYEQNTVLSQTTANHGKNLSIKYYFTRPVQSGDTRLIRLQYTVHGALRSYDEGDELFWAALPEDLSFPVERSRVQVILNDDMSALNVAGYPDGWEYSAAGNVLAWDSPHWPSDDGMFEVRVKYPHDPAMAKPDWQPAADREQWYVDHVQPVTSLLVVVLTGVVGFGGSLWVILRYLSAGRDPETVTVPEYLTEPPSDEHPAVVGLLVDEKADMQDVMAVLIDLARRGYLVIEQTQESTLGMFKSTDFTFHRTEMPADDLRDF
ncbi:MAG: DUF2207 domain-containing protein [Anaerolineae bacterium]|nr:DUF2207 domain-containing protein [Anaerolineae bacterium]